ncbi:MAG: serine peptidase, partial [Thiohalorhabdaceae bacterium]
MAAPVAGAQKLPDFTGIVEEQGPAVVNISTTQKISAQGEGRVPPQFEGTPFEDFFERFFGQRGPRQERETQSL